MNILIVIIASILTGILGRAGGSGNYPRQTRMIGVPLISIATAFFLGCHSWWLLLTMGLMVGALSTYWDFLFNDTDNFFMHGFVIGLTLIPISIVTGHWLGVSLAIALYTLWMGFWSKLINWDVAEEFGRYMIIPIGIWLLMI